MSQKTQQLIEQARDKWIQRLTDLSRRNNLLYYRALKSGTLELIDVNPKLFNALLQGKSVVITDLLPKKDNQINPEIIKQINAIYKRSISNLEERGLRTLFLAYGMVTWTANDGGRSPQAPLILIPISVEKKGEIKLSRYGEAQINPVLLYFLEKEYGYQITPEQLLNGESDIAEDEIPNIKNIAEQLTEIVKNIPDFSINLSSAILSNFAFQKMSMVRDLREHFTALLNNKLILALAGDVSAQQSVKGYSTAIDPRKLDEINPDDEFLVFDADSSQQTVIDSALKGYNGVIQGPPGTGKSQTIANLIVTLSAQGKRVLFVAEKRAALEVVKKRLEQKKLGHLLLDLHGSDISRKVVMEQIAESLTLIRNSSPINADAIHRKFIEKRQQLNNHVKRLHIKRKPSQKSVYEIQSEILLFTAEEQCQTRFRGNILDKITTNVSQIEHLLIELSSPSLANLFLKQSSSVWLSMNLSSREDAVKISDLVRKINQTLKTNVLIPLANITSYYGITSVNNLQSILFLLENLDRIERYLSLYKSEIFSQNLERWLEVLSPLQNSESARIFETIISLLNINDYNLSQKVSDLLKLSSEISQTLSLYREQIFKENLEQLIQDLRSADRGIFGPITNLFNDKLNQARDKIKRLRFSDQASDEDLIRETRQALEQLKRWRNLVTHTPFPEKINLLANINYQLKQLILSQEFWNIFLTIRQLRHSSFNSITQVIEDIKEADTILKQWRSLCVSNSSLQSIIPYQELKNNVNQLLHDLSLIQNKLNHINFNQLSLTDLENLFQELNSDSETPFLLATVREIEQQINNYGAIDILVELKNIKSQPSVWSKQFRYSWLYSCLEKAYIEEPLLRTFHGQNQDQIIAEFRELDQKRLEIAQLRVARNYAEKAISIMNQYPEEESLVRREANKKARHLPLRRLLAKAPHVLTSLRPCWMASPLSVSQLLDAESYFDVVIFDEASQILPEDAVPALMRAKKVIVAGDCKQLPPTNFFTINVDEGEETEDLTATEGFESFLDLTSSFLNSWQLQWHYRSRSEELIAFSNRHIYNNSLITFPGIKNSDVISHILVPSILGQDGQEESANNEVEKVVEIVLKQATEKPNETLGVITMGIKHAQKIEFALEQKLKERPELTPFFNEDNYEHFFVKNIERVQGDERDTIILSIGYGKDRSGKLPHRFGPLLYKGGERRLNVAISRARKSMILVSSFDHYDIDPNRTKARGVELLRLYLQYTSSGGKLLGDRGYSDIPLNAFEQDIFNALTANGINLIPQFGVSNYRIDMVAKHPEKTDQFVLAIECDGASYHSSPTARERDRLRQQQLESLGWRFHRIWSTDWFNNKEQEIKRTIEAFKNAVKYADNYDLSIQNTVEEKKPNNDTPKTRSMKPDVPEKSYQIRDAIKIIEWILSDGSLPTDEEILKETRLELGFKRSGKKIDDLIREAIKRVRN